MDTGTMIITIILFALCILPFAYMQLKSKQRERDLLNALKQLAGKHQANITQHDISGHLAIGADDHTNQLFFFKNIKGRIESEAIKIENIKKCVFLKTQKNGEVISTNNPMIDKAELAFEFKDNAILRGSFEFYNVATDGFNVNNQLLLADKWFRIINGKAGAF